MHRFHRRLCAALVLFLLQIAAWSIASTAEAHPYGPLQLAEIATDRDQVTVTWRFGATDDISYLAAALEALPPERILLDGVILYQDGDEKLLTESARFDEYLTEHIVATRSGTACSGQVRETADLVDDGITVAFDCPAASGPVSITIDMLFDLHPAYRTLATSSDGQRGEYIAEDATHDWDLALASSSDEGSAPMWIVATGVIAVLCLGVAGGSWWWRRVSESATTATASRHPRSP